MTENQNWSKNKIKRELMLKNLSLQDISKIAGFDRYAASQALNQPWPKLEKAIAAALGQDAKTIWPDRYPKNQNNEGELK